MRRLERPLAVVAALAALPWALGLVPLARFTRERIELEVRPGALVVDGRYVYENPLPLPVTQGLDVPFFTDDALRRALRLAVGPKDDQASANA